MDETNYRKIRKRWNVFCVTFDLLEILRMTFELNELVFTK